MCFESIFYTLIKNEIGTFLVGKIYNKPVSSRYFFNYWYIVRDDLFSDCCKLTVRSFKAVTVCA